MTNIPMTRKVIFEKTIKLAPYWKNSGLLSNLSENDCNLLAIRLREFDDELNENVKYHSLEFKEISEVVIITTVINENYIIKNAKSVLELIYLDFRLSDYNSGSICDS